MRENGVAPGIAMQPKSGPGSAITLTDLASSVGSVVPGSSVGPSASEAGSSADILRAISDVQAGLSGLGARLDQLEKKGRCFNCGSNDHTLVQCTQPIDPKHKKYYDRLVKEGKKGE